MNTVRCDRVDPSNATATVSGSPDSELMEEEEEDEWEWAASEEEDASLVPPMESSTPADSTTTDVRKRTKQRLRRSRGAARKSCSWLI